MSGITQVKIGTIAPSKANTRRKVDENSIAELAESLKQLGMLQPIIVRPLGDGFEIVCGERRYLAARKAKLKEVPCIVRELTDDEAEDYRITENLQRQDISPLDEAEAYRLLVEHRQYTPVMIATRFGKSETYVRHRLQLNNLITPFAELLEKEVITIGHALEIGKLSPINQVDYFNNKFENTDSRYFTVPTVTNIRDSIKRLYSSKLSDATFKLDEVYPCYEHPCTLCPHNTAFNTLLFPDMNTEGICLYSTCYAAKTEYEFRKNLVKVVDEEPATVLAAVGYLSDESRNDVDQLINQGLLIEHVAYRTIIDEPVAPDASDYEMDDPDQVENFNDDVDEYKKDLEEYNKEIATARKVFVVAGNNKGTFVYAKPVVKDTEQAATPETGTVLSSSEIEDLKKKDKRNLELKLEKTYFESIEMLKELQYAQNVDSLSDLEWAAMMKIMWFAVGTELAKEMGIDERDMRHTVTIEQLINLTSEQRNQVMRSYLLNKLYTSTPGYMVEESKAIIKIGADSFPDEAANINKKQEEIYQKRKKAIDQRIYELERLQTELAIK